MPTYDAGSIEARITLDRSPFEDGLAVAQQEGQAFESQTFTAHIDFAVDDASAAKLQAEIAAVSGQHPTVDVDLGVNAASAAKLAAEMAAIGAASGGGRDGSLAAGSLGAIFGTGAAGILDKVFWGEGGGGFIARLLSPLTMLGTIFSAGFGSLGQFAGFGPEHLIMSLVGLMSSGVAGGLGAGLLGLGTVGSMAVGGGSDMLVSHVALSNVEALIKGTETLAQVTAQVGPVAAAAEEQVATAYSGMKKSFDLATGSAQAEVAGIGVQLIHLADEYIPMVAAAATRNFALIQQGLQPLLAWLSGAGGTGVFQALENTFATNLPNAMGALDQGLEFLFRTMALAAPSTGRLVKDLDKLFTYANSTTGWDKWEKIVSHLVADFRMWMAFFGELVSDIELLFSKDADTAKALVEWMTKGLTTLHKWMSSTSGSDALTSIFTVHRKEIIALLNALVGLFAAFTELYLSISPPLVTAMTALVNLVTELFDAMGSNPITAFALGIGLIATRFFGFMSVLKFILNPIGTLIKGFGAVKTALGPLGDLLSGLIGPWGLVLLAVLALAGGFYLLYTHVQGFRQGVDTVVGAVVASFRKFVGWVEQLVAGLERWLTAHWAQISADLKITWNIISTAASIVWAVIAKVVTVAWNIISTIISVALAVIIPILEVAWSVIFNGVTIAWTIITTAIRDFVLGLIGIFDTISGIVSFLTGVWQTVTSDIKTAWGAITSWFGGVPEAIVAAFGDAATILYDVGEDIVTGLLEGIQSVWSTVTSWLGNEVGDLEKVARNVLGALSPSRVFMVVGQTIGQGLALGITSGGSAAITATGQLASRIAGVQYASGSGLGGVGVVGASTPSGTAADSVVAAINRLGAKIDALPRGYRLAQRTA